MKTVAVIPARFGSTRLEGKPLKDIHGKPMIWWVHKQVVRANGLDEIYVATDDSRIIAVCDDLGMKNVMTSTANRTHIDRVFEVSLRIDADYYLCVNGDEPLLNPMAIEKLVPKENHITTRGPYVANAMTAIRNPVELVDPSRIKVLTDVHSFGMYMGRNPMPFPKGSSNFKYMKYVGIECFSGDALKFFSSTPKGRLEAIEDVDHLRFLENGVKMKFVEVETENLSVDTEKDLEVVRKIIGEKLASGEMTNE